MEEVKFWEDEVRLQRDIKNYLHSCDCTHECATVQCPLLHGRSSPLLEFAACPDRRIIR